jgi:formylglycine-generating enzyme required for sulfatase activity
MKRRIGIILSIAIFAVVAGVEIKASVMPTIFIKNLVPAKIVKKDDAARLNKLIVESIVKMQRYDVMSDDQINQLLDNTAKQQLLGCNSEECFAQIMETTQADFILYGDIEKEGKGYIISVSLIQRVKGGSSTLKGSSNTELIDFSFNSMKSHADLIIRDVHGVGGQISKPEQDESKKGKTEKIGNIEMVFIPGGTFTMGSPKSEKGRSEDEKQHKVTVSSFWMGKYEVTQKQYKDVTGTNLSNFKGDNLQVEQVSWYDAVEYCNKLSEKNGLKSYYKIDKSTEDPNNKNKDDDLKYTVTILGGNGFRLPTEAEWEYACRGGTTTIFHYGDSLDSTMANFDGNNPYNGKKRAYRGKTTEVGSFKPNAYGLYDTHGNVWEWCWDWYDEGYYDKSPVEDPENSDSGEYRVLRGGSWISNGDNLRSADRGWYGAGNRDLDVGFRVVRSVS